MTGTASAHHRGAPATQVFTVPNMNYRQHQRDQADRRFAAQRFEPLVFGRIRGFTLPIGAGALGGAFLFCAAPSPGPIRQSVATIDLASVGENYHTPEI